MKKLKVIVTVLLFIFTANTHTAAAITATPSATTFLDKLKQIEVLKEKIATKVAELRKIEKGGIYGAVKSVGDTSITITSKSKEQIISYGEDTVFFKMNAGIKSDPIDSKQAKKLKPGEQIVALGYYESAGTLFSTKYIYIYSPSIHIIGKIADKDQENFTVTVKELKGNTLVDIETYTKMFLFNKKTGLARSGFSKLVQNNIVHLYAIANQKEENRVSAAKIISFTFGPNTSPTPTEEKEATPTAKPAGN